MITASAMTMLEDLDVRVDHLEMSAFDTAEVDAYDFARMVGEWEGLRDAVRQAMADDGEEATTFWSELGKRITDLFQYNKRLNEFRERARKLLGNTEAALNRIHDQVWTDLGQHASAPEKLRNDAEAWMADRSKVTELIAECKKLGEEAPNWNDDARAGYDDSVAVQVTAMTELAGVLASAAKSCNAGARLNNAIFSVVGRSMTSAHKLIGKDGGGGGDRYERTARALNELEMLESLIKKATSGAVTDGSVRLLSGDLRKTMDMPNLLVPDKWPSGRAGAGVAAADTASGVDTDGRLVNRHVQGDRGATHDGIHR